MAGTEQERVKKLLLESFSVLDNEIEVILITGSILSSEFSHSSDIDLILTVKKANFKTKKAISTIVGALEKDTKRKLGVNIVETSELFSPIDPLNSLDGKTYQALIEIDDYKNMVLHDPANLSVKFFKPSAGEIKKHSCQNVYFFKLRERKLSTHEHNNKSSVDSTLDRKIRASFIVSKLAIQALEGKTINGKSEIIARMKEMMPDQLQLLSVLTENIHFKQGNSEVKKIDLLAHNDEYLEEVSRYVSRF